MNKNKCLNEGYCPPKKIWTDEVYYSGKYIRKLRVNTGDVLTDILEKIGAIVGVGDFGVISVNGYDGIVQLDLTYDQGVLGLTGSLYEVDLNDDFAKIHHTHTIEDVTGLEKVIEDLQDEIQNNSDKNYVYVQGMSSDTWEIHHPLNKKVSVSILDTAGTVVEGQVTINNGSLVVVEFKYPFSGEAVLN